MKRHSAYKELLPTVFSRSIIQYIGSVHISNLGDDVLVQIARDLFAPIHVQSLLTTSRYQKFLSALTGYQRRILLLGGGTLLNHTMLMHRVEDRLKNCSAAFTFGTGVNDPHSGIEGDLKRETETLKRFQRVTVRGPYSKAMLEAQGLCGVDIIGDSAFCLIPEKFPQIESEKVAILNYGIINEASLVGDGEKIERTFLSVAKALVQQGYKIKLLVVRPCDGEPTRQLAEKIGAAHISSIFTEFHDVSVAQSFLRGASCFVGLKMHAGVIAMSAGVPALLIEYQLKVRDLLEGVGLSRYLVSSTGFSAERILSQLDEIETNRVETVGAYIKAGIEARSRYAGLARSVGEVIR